MTYITKQFLKNYEGKSKVRIQDSKVLFESIQSDYDYYDIFISYSSKDLEYVEKIVQLLQDHGFSVYIDNCDSLLDKNNVTKETPKRLATIMNNCRCIVYICTDNSLDSSWCPWEIGYMSCKSNFKCAIFPVVDNIASHMNHREFLLAYPEIVSAPSVKSGEVELVLTTGEHETLEEFIED